MDSDSANKQMNVLFTGRVQGVGFRWTCRSIASRYNIKGWVKNLSDGRVELLLQADPKKIAAFLGDLREEFKGYILNEETEWLKPEEDYRDFGIRF